MTQRIAVLNFSGNVGKTVVASHLLKPRMPGAKVFSIESINTGADTDGIEVEKMRGKAFGALADELLLADSAIIDVGASNVEDFFKYMGQFAGSHEDFDYFLVPTVSEKKQQAGRLGISCDIDIQISHVAIDDFSITTIIGNLFDNAITAAQKCSSPWVRASLSQSGSYLELTIDNCHCEKIKEKNGEFATTKKDKNLLHGIGIKNVRKVVSDLNGQIDISYTDDTFHVGILLPNYE